MVLSPSIIMLLMSLHDVTFLYLIPVHEILFCVNHHRTGSVPPEPQESEFYGDLDIREVVPVVDSNRGDVDVAGMHNVPMPPDRYNLISVAEIEQRRCSTEEKRNDFQGKLNALQA